VSDQLFRYAVLWHPTDEDQKKGVRSRVVVQPSDWVLAKSEKEVVMLATKAIPDPEMQQADQLEVSVQPF
jgi:hypothetical protein